MEFQLNLHSKIIPTYAQHNDPNLQNRKLSIIISSYRIALACGVLLFGFSAFFFVLGLRSWYLNEHGATVMMGLSFLLLFLVAIVTERTINGYVIIKADGIEFPKAYGRKFIAWGDFKYARIIDIPFNTQFIRFYTKGSEDWVACILVGTEACVPVLASLSDIPLLGETEAFHSPSAFEP